jgi:hypothetical protein
MGSLRTVDPNNRITVVRESSMKIESIEEIEREAKVIKDAIAALRVAFPNKR